MVFSSYIFIFGFLPVTLIGFWLISCSNHRFAKIWLCVTSVFFYGWWNPAWAPLLMVSIIFNYCIGNAILARAASHRPTSLLLGAGVAANLGALIYYKYLVAILGLFGVTTTLAPHGLPLGISFFTFTQIAFLVDVSQAPLGRYTPINYFLFVTFFPHLIAGPIVHHADLMPQFENEKTYRLRPGELAIGLAIFSIGLAKKTLIADNLSDIPDRLLAAGSLGPEVAWVGALAYSMQLYFDFSGYSDMAIGLARLFGVRFPINFNSPYKATSIIEFWQRWHITLTRFLTSYLYNPLTLTLFRRWTSRGRTRSPAQTLTGFTSLIGFPTFVTMTLAGIWHGAGLQFVVFGALHGLYITVNHAWRSFGPRHINRANGVLRIVYIAACGALVYLCVLIAQIFFWADSVSQAVAVLAGMISVQTAPDFAWWSHMIMSSPVEAPGAGLERTDLLLLASAMATAWLAPNTQQIMANYGPALGVGQPKHKSPWQARMTVGWALGFGVILYLGLLNIRSGQPFIYFQF